MPSHMNDALGEWAGSGCLYVYRSASNGMKLDRCGFVAETYVDNTVYRGCGALWGIFPWIAEVQRGRPC
ncbi:hypothetical protein PISMIDRAFT_677280 [Pisolithus microcarpus 441]|uniref:Unplaced genomic scaffold scaffold_25, whole genome shotgun sequence n=1 Tax=Pisolithus microcarpus 441 TaxID=765257 RepID=A0A0C9Z7I2_9AGAM|nr:hypothetical protein PISMIDRAFT_677280 [Pisolithus microcarpus 441]